MQTVDRAELKRWLDEGRHCVLVDVLPPEAYRAFHLPGPVDVPVHSAPRSSEPYR
jgi:rhodanese-related sulfurtransferase